MQTALSWFLAATTVFGSGERQADYFSELAAAMPFAWLRSGLAGNGLFESDVAYLAAFYTPLLVQTACFAGALWIVARMPADKLRAAGERLLLWACAFALAAVFAFNVQTQDIWLTIAWGRQLLAGADPYLVAYSVADTAGLPLDHEPFHMTYGPLWLLLGAPLAWIAGASPLLAWAISKLILLAAWLACLYLVRAIAEPFGWRRTAAAVAIVGWMPVGVHSGVAEGHNDVVMAAFALLWAKLLTSASWRGPLALALSCCAKYVTAPLGLVDLLYYVRMRTLSPAAYVTRVLPAAIVAGAAAFFLLSDGQLSGAASMRTWHFLGPSDLLRLLEYATGEYIPGKSTVVGLVFVMIALGFLARFWSEPSLENTLLAQLAIMTAVLFNVGHVWPWFFLWVVPFAALVPNNGLSVFVLSAALVSPFTIVHWVRFQLEGAPAIQKFLIPSLLMYGFAIAMTAFWVSRSRSRRPLAAAVAPAE